MKMKNILTAIAFCLSSVSAVAQGYSVQGSIQGLNDGDTIQLYQVGHKFSMPYAETVVKGGKFAFTGNQADPRGMLLVVKNTTGNYPFILDNSQIGISGKANVQANDGGRSIDYSAVKVSGSPLSLDFQSKISVRKRLDDEYEAYHKAHQVVLDELRKAQNAKDSVRINAIQATDAFKKFSADEAAFFKNVQDSYNKLYADNKDSWWGPLLIEFTMSYLTPNEKPLYDMLSEEAKNSFYGKMVRDEVAPPDLSGEPVKQFTLNDGKTLKEVLAGKKYLLIDFWASWCVPCRKEIPNLKAQYAKYADKGLQILSISIDKDKKAWQAACDKEQFPWLSYLDNGTLADLYEVRFIPATFLVDSNGKLVGDNLVGEKLADKLAELFK